MLSITKNKDHTAAQPLIEGMNIATGDWAIFSDVPGTFDLFKNGVRFSPFFPHAENGAPYDMFSSNGANANMFTFVTAANWRLDFTPKSGAKLSINFTTGTVTPPPPPIEAITEMYVENGQFLIIKTATATYKVPTPLVKI